MSIKYLPKTKRGVFTPRHTEVLLCHKLEFHGIVIKKLFDIAADFPLFFAVGQNIYAQRKNGEFSLFVVKRFAVVVI